MADGVAQDPGRALKIDILFYAYEPGLGDSGGVRKVLSLAKGMREIGHTVRVFLPRFLDVHEPGVIPYPAPERGLLRPLLAYPLMIWTAWRMAQADRPDIVYQRTGLSVLPGLLARGLGARFFFEVNGDLMSERGRKGRFLRVLPTFLAEWINCRLAYRVIPISPGLQEVVEKRYGVSRARIRLVPSGTDVKQIQPRDPLACRSALSLAPKEELIVFLGVLYVRNGVGILLDAVRGVLERYPRTRFLILGDGPVRGALEAQARALGIEQRVVFVGRVPYDQVALYLGAADCCVAPYTQGTGECSPLKLFDYMAAARPIVASEIPPLQSVIQASQAIVPVAPEDASGLAETLCALLGDGAWRDRLGQAGRRFVERHHDWRTLAQVMLQP